MINCESFWKRKKMQKFFQVYSKERKFPLVMFSFLVTFIACWHKNDEIYFFFGKKHKLFAPCRRLVPLITHIVIIACVRACVWLEKQFLAAFLRRLMRLQKKFARFKEMKVKIFIDFVVCDAMMSCEHMCGDF